METSQIAQPPTFRQFFLPGFCCMICRVAGMKLQSIPNLRSHWRKNWPYVVRRVALGNFHILLPWLALLHLPGGCHRDKFIGCDPDITRRCVIHPLIAPASIPLPFFTSIACVGHLHCLIRSLRLRLPTLPLSRTISVWRTCKVTNKQKQKKQQKSTRTQGRALLPPQFSPSRKTKRKAPAGSYRVEFSHPWRHPFLDTFVENWMTCHAGSGLRIFCTKPGRPFQHSVEFYQKLYQTLPPKLTNIQCQCHNSKCGGKEFFTSPQMILLKISSQDWCPSMPQYPSFVELA